MSLLEAIALGLVQGLTEFFPVSSSGHLVLVEALIGVNPSGVSFEVLVHLATLAAVLLVYRARIIEILRGSVTGHGPSLRYVGKLVLGSIPAAVVGILGAEAISRTFDAPSLAAANLLVTGAIVYSTRWLLDRGQARQPGWAGSLAIGFAQAVAILPGISRSGATVVTALWARTERTAAAEFSFLLSVPAILGASALELPALVSGGLGLPPLTLAAAAVSAFAAAVAAIVLFVRWLQTGAFHRFAYYCWGLGGLYLGVRLLGS